MSIRSGLQILSALIFGMMIACPAATAAEPPEINIDTITIREGFEPGNGKSVGEIRQASGTVIVVHQSQDYGYRVTKDADLFKDDTIITGADGSAAFKLSDGSFISLSPGAQMTINQSVYAPEQKTRSSFLKMVSGKARFVVKKFVDARHSEFKVKTKTSVAGVRGSDFIITASETITEITTLEHTALEVISLAEPDAEPLILNDFEQTEIRIGMLPSEAQKARSEDIDRLMKEFRFQPPPGDIQQEMGAVAMISAQRPDKPKAPLEKIRIPRNELPDPRLIPPQLAAPVYDQPRNLFRSQRILMDEQDIKNTNTQIYQNINETKVKKPLPDFPGTP